MQNIHPLTELSLQRERESVSEKNKTYVLDSNALFALLQNEEGQRIVADLIEVADKEQAQLFLSLINWGEILYIVEREQGRHLAQLVMNDIGKLPILFCGVDQDRIAAAAHIKARYPIAYADAFAVALAQEIEAPVVTGDPEFKKVESLVDVLWIRTV